MKLRRKVLLAAASLVVSVLLAELGLRMFFTNPFRGTRPDHVVRLLYNHGGLDQDIERRRIDAEVQLVRFRVHSRGYIEPAFRFGDPDLTVVFFGGSTTECVAVQERLRFPALVSRNLEKDGLKVNTLNVARARNTAHDSINVLFNHVIVDSPDVAVMMHATNDAGVLNQGSGYRRRMGSRGSVSKGVKYALQVLSARSSLFGLVRNAVSVPRHRHAPSAREGGRPIPPNVEPFRARLRIFVGMCRALGITPVLMTQPLVPGLANELTPTWTDPRAQNALNVVIREVGGEKGALVIDLAARVAKENSENLEKMFYDSMHVSDYGSEIYARIISEQLRDLLISLRSSYAASSGTSLPDSAAPADRNISGRVVPL